MLTAGSRLRSLLTSSTQLYSSFGRSRGLEAEEAAGPTQVVEDDSASVNATVASAAVGSANTVGTFTLGTHSVAYRDLPLAARKLDAMLYNIFKSSIKGSEQALLQSVTFPSYNYVQAVIVLVKHNIMDISRASRIGHAFSGLRNLYFHGAVLRFQSDFLAVKRELDTTGASVTHLIMTLCQLMKAFDGKSKTVQFKIADDINKMDVDGPDINLYDISKTIVQTLLQ